jgi:hypothetical protein
MNLIWRLTVAVLAIAAICIAGAPASADEHNPCAPQPMLKRCDQMDTCRVAGAAPFQNKSMSKADRVRYYKHCVWLEERYRLERGNPKGFVLDPRDHRQRKVKTRSYPLLRRAECEQQGKKPYC